MLPRLTRTVALAPRLARSLAANPVANPVASSSRIHLFAPIDEGEGYISDDSLIERDSPLTCTQQNQDEEQVPQRRLSYEGLPDYRIYLAIPPAEDPLLRYITSAFLRDGRRHNAERRVARLLMFLHTLTRADALSILRDAIDRVAPDVKIKRLTSGAKQTAIPVPLDEKQRVKRAMKWILDESLLRGGRTVEERFAREVILIMNGESGALKKKDELHKQAMINRCVIFQVPLPFIIDLVFIFSGNLKSGKGY